MATRFAELGPDQGLTGILKTNSMGETVDWELGWLVNDIENFGEAGIEAGPMLVRLLSRKDAPGARAEAALAIGKIGYQDGAAELLRQSSDFSDDWALAYNAADSLGHLRYAPARPILQHMAADYWLPVVRFNAERAINMIDGGAFERPNVPGDGARPEMIFIGMGSSVGGPLYAGDHNGFAQSCVIPSDLLSYPQLLVGPLPSSSADVLVELKPVMPDLEKAPLPGWRDFQHIHGDVTFVVPFPDGLLFGVDRGEWGGEVYVREHAQQPLVLIADNGIAAFAIGKKLMLVTGLSHLAFSEAQLWVIDMSSAHPVVERSVRLPMEPRAFLLAPGGELIMTSPKGDVAIRADGTLVDVRTIAACKPGPMPEYGNVY